MRSRPRYCALAALVCVGCVGAPRAGGAGEDPSTRDALAALEVLGVDVMWESRGSAGAGYLSLDFEGCVPSEATRGLLAKLPRVDSVTVHSACDLELLRELRGPTELTLTHLRAGNLDALRPLLELEHAFIDASAHLDVSALADLPNLTLLQLRGGPFSGLEHLQDLPRLASLNIDDPSLADLGFVAGLASLYSLDVNGSAIEDLSPLRGSSSLRSLSAAGTRVRNLEPLADLELSTLNLSYSPVAELEVLSTHESLLRLSLICTEVSDIRAIAGLDRLVRLNIAGTKVSDCGPLSGLRELETLTLLETQVRDLACLQGLDKLETLALGTVTSFAPLRDQPSLTTIYASSVPADGVEILATLPALRELSVPAGTLSEAALDTLTRARPGLRVTTSFHVPLDLICDEFLPMADPHGA